MKVFAGLLRTASLVVPATAAPGAQPVPAAPATQSVHDRLFQLFNESDEAYLKRNPLQALSRGDYGYADRLGDLYRDPHFQAEKTAARPDPAALHTIPRTALNSQDQLAYGVVGIHT